MCIDDAKRIIGEERILMPSKIGKKIVISMLLKCIETLCADYPRKLTGIGIAAPGAIEDGVVKRSPNLPFLDSTDLSSLLPKRFKTNVVVDNDVNCMAFGESVGRSEKNIIALTLGTGIGCGLILGGKVHRGRSFAGEAGHMTIKFDGSRCACGNLGCFEEYASVRSVRRLSAKHLGKSLEPREVCELADTGDRKAKKVWKEYGRMVGIGLANLSLIMDPEIIVLGGGISKAFKHFKSSMKAEMKERMFIPLPKIVTGRSNGNAYGAACMVLDHQD